MEGSKKTTTCFGHICSSTKNKQRKRKKKDITLSQKVCCQTIHQISIGSLWLQLVWKTSGLGSKNRTVIHTFRKTKGSKKHTIVNNTKWALKKKIVYWCSRCNVWSKYLLFISYKAPDPLLNPIWFHSQWFKILWHFLSWWANGKSWLLEALVISRLENKYTF